MADAAALRAGLRLGVVATKAQALVSNLIVMDAEPEADAQALERLAIWALQRYAPIVAADPPDGLVIDTTGAAHLHRGEDAMVAGLVERLAASGIAARAALADSWGAPMPSPAIWRDRRSSLRRAKPRRQFSTCPSPPCACPERWWKAFASSVSNASASWRQNPAPP